ncbi:unnamed protein product [Lepeophtheirus salmonis]|uniref:(salmon louse) hypothetical protein n=1 Tax=Lepeophtheirus salmonis TaxID=72036 RepID=A0A7R8HFK2_LEPSM|nr:unnamed protein product [Lepeophtheirus salmonis]CAF3045986.1 unnamed protein product [Lepeophtheirus salmonis]
MNFTRSKLFFFIIFGVVKLFRSQEVDLGVFSRSCTDGSLRDNTGQNYLSRRVEIIRLQTPILKFTTGKDSVVHGDSRTDLIQYHTTTKISKGLDSDQYVRNSRYQEFDNRITSLEKVDYSSDTENKHDTPVNTRDMMSTRKNNTLERYTRYSIDTPNSNVEGLRFVNSRDARSIINSLERNIRDSRETLYSNTKERRVEPLWMQEIVMIWNKVSTNSGI